MNYYKIIKDGVIVGAITSNDFMRYLPITDCFVRANDQNGEYVTYKNQFYRATWMRPIVYQVAFIEALILAITEEEYEAYIHAFEIHEIIEQEIMEEAEEMQEQIEAIDPIEQASIEFIRTSKIQEMSHECRFTIEAGFDLELRGETHHFSLNTQDQLNLMSLSEMAKTQSLIPYHADGEECIFYTAEEINEIVETANAFRIYNTTYYNMLKNYINTLETIEEISAIEYGTEVPEQYQSEVFKVLNN